MAGGVTISLAGRVSVGVAGHDVDAALGPRGRVALAYLTLERWRPVPRDELADVVWGRELPTTWRAALRGVVSRIRVSIPDTAKGASAVPVPGSSEPQYPRVSVGDVTGMRERHS